MSNSSSPRRRKLSVRDSVLLGWRYDALADKGYDDTTIRKILARGDAYASRFLNQFDDALIVNTPPTGGGS